MVPAVPTPPTTASAAATAKALLLMDMEFLSGNLSRTLRTTVDLPPRQAGRLAPAGH